MSKKIFNGLGGEEIDQAAALEIVKGMAKDYIGNDIIKEVHLYGNTKMWHFVVNPKNVLTVKDDKLKKVETVPVPERKEEEEK